MKKIFSAVMTVVLCIGIMSAMPKARAEQKPVGAGRVNTSSTSLNVRSSPSSSAKVKATLKKNTYVTLISKSGSYWYVRYSAESYGYCHADYIYQVSAAVRTVKTTSGNLRVRSSASLNASVQDHLPSGTYVTVHTADGVFSRIIYNGNKVGYVHSSYLVNSNASSTDKKYSAISLNVPNYKQTDPRWANVTLGSSGQTMGKIGCATTALAMTESFRTGTTVYPNQMASKLSYTSGGAVYWPSNYTTVTSSSGYSEKIYSALKQGKPVIVGAKKSNGSQHYVVVKGVSATDTLTASAFLINDPGSNSRTTLAQFFSVYPNFYKMLYVK